MSIFISYKRDHKPSAEKLANLISSGTDDKAWFDINILSGEEWWNTILEEIKKSDAFVLFFTQDYLESDACKKEFDYARCLKKNIVLVLSSEDDIRPTEISRYQYLVFQENSDFNNLFLKSIKRQKSALPDPLPYPPRFPDSEKNYLLIPGTTDGDSFNDRLRKCIEPKKEKLKISRDIYDENTISPVDWVTTYIKGWEEFIGDENAEWLFTVHPEDKDLDGKISEIIDKRNNIKAKKYVLFFESSPNISNAKEVYIFSIKTDYNNAVTTILRKINIKLRNIGTLLIFLLLGPDVNSANIRRDLYQYYLSHILYGYEMEKTLSFISESTETTKEIKNLASQIRPNHINIVALPMGNWLAKTTKDILNKQLKFSPFGDEKSLGDWKVLVLCGNDDIALASLEVLKEHMCKFEEEKEILCAGFDGGDKMIELIEKQKNKKIWAITASVKTEYFIDRAVKIVDKIGNNENYNIDTMPIAATIRCSDEEFTNKKS